MYCADNAPATLEEDLSDMELIILEEMGHNRAGSPSQEEREQPSG